MPRLLSFVFAVLLMSPLTLWAQSDQDTATARALSMEAQKALEAEDFETAADRFGRAEELHHAPTLLLGLARAYVGLGKFVEAQESYNKVIRETLPASAPPAFRNAVDDAKREVVGLDKKIGWVTINVSGTDQPTVTVDGLAVPIAALGVRRAANPGSHEVKASAEGFKPAQATFEISAGGEEDVTLTLEPDPDATGAVGTGSGGGGPKGGEVPPDDGASPMVVGGAVALGIGGVGLIVGAVTGGLAMGAHSDLEARCPAGSCSAVDQDTIDSFHTLGAISTVGFIAGGVLAAGGLVMILVAPSDDGADTANAPRFSAEVGLGEVRATLRF